MGHGSNHAMVHDLPRFINSTYLKGINFLPHSMSFNIINSSAKNGAKTVTLKMDEVKFDVPSKKNSRQSVENSGKA